VHDTYQLLYIQSSYTSWWRAVYLLETCRGYLLTPWSRFLLEKLTGSGASQEIPLIFGTRRFLTVLTSAHHLSLSWANSIQSPQPPTTSWRSILMLSSHLRLGLPSGHVDVNYWNKLRVKYWILLVLTAQMSVFISVSRPFDVILKTQNNLPLT
jgi:hypothetical protein